MNRAVAQQAALLRSWSDARKTPFRRMAFPGTVGATWRAPGTGESKAAATNSTTSSRQRDIVASWGAALRSRTAGSQDESRRGAIHKQRPYQVLESWVAFCADEREVGECPLRCEGAVPNRPCVSARRSRGDLNRGRAGRLGPSRHARGTVIAFGTSLVVARCSLFLARANLHV